MMRQTRGMVYQAYCRGIRPAGGRVIAWLRAHGPSPSRQCRPALLAAPRSG